MTGVGQTRPAPQARAGHSRDRVRFLVAWALVMAVGVMLDSTLYRRPILVLFTFVLGAIPQWLLLRRFVPRAWPWLIMTPIAGIVAGVLWVWLGLMAGTIVSHLERSMAVRQALLVPAFIFVGGVQGSVVGIGQWRVLRGSAPEASHWIGWSALAWALGAGLMFLSPLAVTVTGAVVGAVVGAITGLALLRLYPGPHDLRDEDLHPTPKSRSGGTVSLRGLNGWLTLFAVEVVLTPLYWTWRLAQGLRESALISWRATSSADLLTAGRFLGLTVAIPLLWVAAYVYLSLLFFRKDRLFPRAWIVVQIVVVGYDGLHFALAGGGAVAFAVELAVAVTLTLYLLRSTRVANTFVTSSGMHRSPA